MNIRFLLIALSIVCSSLFCQAQFIDGNKFECGGGYVNTLSDLLKDSSATGFTIFPTLFDFSDDVIKAKPIFPQLECISFQFSFSPESTEVEKMEFINQLKISLSAFEFLLKSPKMKAVHFQIGEQIFMSNAEVKKCNYKWNCMEKTNLTNAWESFGKALQTSYPNIKFYANNWGW